MTPCTYHWNILNLHMFGLIRFDIKYESTKDMKFLGIVDIDRIMFYLIFEREKGTRVFKFHHNNSIKVGNMHYYTYKFGYYEYYDYNYYPRKLVEERRMHLNWCPYKEG